MRVHITGMVLSIISCFLLKVCSMPSLKSAAVIPLDQVFTVSSIDIGLIYILD